MANLVIAQLPETLDTALALKLLREVGVNEATLVEFGKRYIAECDEE